MHIIIIDCIVQSRMGRGSATLNRTVMVRFPVAKTSGTQGVAARMRPSRSWLPAPRPEDVTNPLIPSDPDGHARPVAPADALAEVTGPVGPLPGLPVHDASSAVAPRTQHAVALRLP
jgi:hypothetical protein